MAGKHRNDRQNPKYLASYDDTATHRVFSLKPNIRLSVLYQHFLSLIVVFAKQSEMGMFWIDNFGIDCFKTENYKISLLMQLTLVLFVKKIILVIPVANKSSKQTKLSSKQTFKYLKFTHTTNKNNQKSF